MRNEKLNELIEQYQSGIATREEKDQLVEWYKNLNYGSQEEYPVVEMLADSKIVKDRIDLVIEPLRYNVLYIFGKTHCRTDFRTFNALVLFLASYLFGSDDCKMELILLHGLPVMELNSSPENKLYYKKKMEAAKIMPLAHFDLNISDTE